MKRTLALKKDTLTELGSVELGSVVGGTASHYSCLPCVVTRVVASVRTLVEIPSIDTPCS